MNPTITKYVDVFCVSDGEWVYCDEAFETLNDALSNLWEQGYDRYEILDDERNPIAANASKIQGSIRHNYKVFTLPYCLKARDTKIYFRKMEDLKHFEGTLYTDEEREIIDGTL